MAAQANITLNTVVYAPGGVDASGTAVWTNRTSGYGAGFARFKEKFTDATKGDVVRMVFSGDIPIVAAVDTDCSCAGGLLRTSTWQLSVWVPASSTAAERLDLYNRIKDSLVSAPVIAGIQNLDPSY